MRTHRDRAMAEAMVLGGLRRCEVLGLRLTDLQVAARRVFIAEGKGGHQRQIPVSGRFLASLAAYLDGERPPDAGTDQVFVVLKGPRRGPPLSPAGLDQILDSARSRAGLVQATCHQLRHTCLTRLREAGMALEAVQAQAGHASIESTRIYLRLADDWLAAQYRRAAEAIDAQVRPAKRCRTTVSWAAITWCPLWTEAGHERRAALPGWEQLDTAVPDLVAPMRRYLQQLDCILRPGSVSGAGLALRSFAAFLAERARDVRFVSDIRRHHVEEFRSWLAARPGRRTARITPATLAHRLGTLRMFFVRISDWGWPEAPARVPIIPADLPRQDHPLPKALDDAAAAKLLRAAQTQPRMLAQVVVEVLLRTGLRVGEFTALTADAVVLIGAAHWLYVPVGKLHEDRYLPLHPHLITLIGDYRAAHVAADNPLLLPRESGRALDRHTVTRLINKAGAAAGLPHIHPHQLPHTLATQAINRGMSLEAIAALLGHRSMDMTLRYANPREMHQTGENSLVAC
ncbi:hypothetical protein GCM10022255_045130 [Dactylosporangium darangshiense]|uniref:Integrase n=1 Tax=Dactylosporangium darangshiense TaxID=579108 RepID=A0ABP8DB00_9ACTN